jgi:pimeloyl-ACP methyl ester carboxylesterase
MLFPAFSHECHGPSATLRRGLAGGVFIFAALALGGCATVGRRLVIPAKLQGDAQAQLPADPAYEVVPLRTRDGTRIFAQFGRAEFPPGLANADPAHAPTVIFFYGSSQNLAAPHNQIVFRGLRAMGANVFIPEYPGNGMSEGSASEGGCYAAADAALDYLLGRPDVDHARIVAAGQSLGSGPAVDLASRRPLAGLITVSGFTTTTEAGMNGVTWMPHWLANALTASVASTISPRSKPSRARSCWFTAHGT